MASGSNRITFGWVLAVMFWFFSIILFSYPTGSMYSETGFDRDNDGVDDGCDSDPDDFFESRNRCENNDDDVEAGACCCLLGFLSLGIVQSGRDAKKKAQTQLIYIPQVQQPAQQVVHHHTTHTYVPQPAPTPVQQVTPAPTATASTKSQAEWAMDARNLEMARDWEGAAKAYQKAGLYQEAGRVREMHIEKKDPQVKIDIGQLGDIVQDSVVMKDGQGQDDEYRV